MTANALDTDRAACLAAGTNEHISKLFDINHLVSTLTRLTHWSEVPQDVVVSAPSNGTDSMHAMDADGMEMGAAIACIGNSLPVYLKVLQSFGQDMPVHSQQLDVYFSQQQKSEALRLVHALKGLAATIGFQSLSNAARALELDIKQAAPEALPHPSARALQGLIEKEQVRLCALMDQLTQTDESAGILDGTKAEDVSDLAGMADQLQGLLPLLEADDMSALEAFAATEQSVPAPFDAPLEQLNEAMASVDFASAAVIARDLLSRIQRTTLN